jgi:2-(1,2-epoxy-1,2-dihydrophenyl)acetyl-CoA isomerase
MEHEHVRLERDGAIATVTLDRPGTRNACSMSMWLAIRDHFRELAESDARVIVLTGANGDFCSGADIVKKPNGEGDSGWEGNKLTAMRVLAQSVTAVHDCPIPVIVKVDGYSVGAGFGLALAGDLLWCSDRARFSAVFAKLGLSLDYGSSWLLAKRIGLHKAKELAFTAEMMDAARAEQLGFVNAVVPAAELDAACLDLLRRATRGSRSSKALGKQGFYAQVDLDQPKAYAYAIELMAASSQTPDAREGMSAFLEKRAPRWSGR